jgi:hypothetical protein
MAIFMKKWQFFVENAENNSKITQITPEARQNLIKYIKNNPKANKIIYFKEDKNIINDFFFKLPQFDDVTWY